MKHLLLFICLLLTVQFLSAQRDQTLFNRGGRIGGFGAPIFDYYNIGSKGDIDIATGGGGALILGDFFVGGYGVGDISRIETLDDGRAEFDLAHGGIWLGFTPLQRSVVHPYASLRMGWGATDVTIRSSGEFTRYSDSFLTFSPEAGVEVNVFRWFRIAGTVGYQWFGGIEENPDVDLDLNNLRVGLTLRFGGFGRAKDKDDF